MHLACENICSGKGKSAESAMQAASQIAQALDGNLARLGIGALGQGGSGVQGKDGTTGSKGAEGAEGAEGAGGSACERIVDGICSFSLTLNVQRLLQEEGQLSRTRLLKLSTTRGSTYLPRA